MKKFVLISACLLTAFAVTACSGSKTEGNSETAAAQEQTTAASEEQGTGTTYETDYGKVTLGQYRGIEYTAAVAEEVTEQDAINYIDKNYSSTTRYEYITTDRAAQLNDRVDIDYAGTIDGVEFSGGTGNSPKLVLGSGSMIPGFEDAIVGHKKGENFDINVTFPDEYTEELAGKPAVFNITINSIKEPLEYKLTDSYVEDLTGGAYTTADEFIKYVQEWLQTSNDEDVLNTNQSTVYQAALNNSQFELSDEALTKEEETVRAYYEQVIYSYYETIEEALPELGLESMDDYNNLISEYAMMNAKTVAFADAVFMAENLELTDEDLQVIADQYTGDIESTISTYGEEDVNSAAKMTKVLSIIYDSAIAQ